MESDDRFAGWPLYTCKTMTLAPVFLFADDLAVDHMLRDSNSLAGL